MGTWKFYFSTSLQLPSNIFKPFSIDYLPDSKSKSTLIPWATEVIIVNHLNEHMENLLRSIFTQQDIIWSFSFLFYLSELCVLYMNKSFITYLLKSLGFSVPLQKKSTMECTIKCSFCFIEAFIISVDLQQSNSLG